ncbi:hypothetical protein CDAR_287661 [Caerostris darwini]|uniref:Uncharacterized protein n=1 Tax=Caerostris darwini TaxID=1538125 RepID=A0AAV4NGJ8_9ARAC|nr:hypothetical protein CDAR_287661 [Caerostris darwini]
MRRDPATFQWNTSSGSTRMRCTRNKTKQLNGKRKQGCPLKQQQKMRKIFPQLFSSEEGSSVGEVSNFPFTRGTRKRIGNLFRRYDPLFWM